VVVHPDDVVDEVVELPTLLNVVCLVLPKLLLQELLEVGVELLVFLVLEELLVVFDQLRNVLHQLLLRQVVVHHALPIRLVVRRQRLVLLILSAVGVAALIVGPTVAALGHEGGLIGGHPVEARLLRRGLIVIVGQVAVLAVVGDLEGGDELLVGRGAASSIVLSVSDALHRVLFWVNRPHLEEVLDVAGRHLGRGPDLWLGLLIVRVLVGSVRLVRRVRSVPPEEPPLLGGARKLICLWLLFRILEVEGSGSIVFRLLQELILTNGRAVAGCPLLRVRVCVYRTLSPHSFDFRELRRLL